MSSLWLLGVLSPVLMILVISTGVMGEPFWERDNWYETDVEPIITQTNQCGFDTFNTRICGMGITNSTNAHLLLANGSVIMSDCLRDEYPRGINGTHYHCADGVWKTVDEAQKFSKESKNE